VASRSKTFCNMNADTRSACSS